MRSDEVPMFTEVLEKVTQLDARSGATIWSVMRIIQSLILNGALTKDHVSNALDPSSFLGQMDTAGHDKNSQRSQQISETIRELRDSTLGSNSKRH